MKIPVHRRKRAVVTALLIVAALLSFIFKDIQWDRRQDALASPIPPASIRAMMTPTTEEYSLVHSVHSILALSFVKLKLEKIVDVQLDEKEAFFLSILSINGTLLASYRNSLSAYTTSVIQLSDNFVPRAETKTTVEGVEDARVFQLDGEGWLVDNHFLNRRVLVSVNGRRRVHLDETSIPNFVRGKNWSPFTHRGSLYFVYSLKPLRVLSCDLQTGKIRWVYEEPQEVNFRAEQLNEMLIRGGTNAVVHDNFIYGIGRETKYSSIACGGKTHHRVAQHFPLLWRFPLKVIDRNFTIPSTNESRDLVEVQRLDHPFRSGVNDPASLFVHNSTIFLTVSSCSCACLPEFRTDANTQYNTVYKLCLS